MKLLISLLLIVSLINVIHSQESSEESAAAPSEYKGKKMVDKLAMNLAGAFVNSLFPQVSKAKKSKPSTPKEPEEDDIPLPTEPREIRRSPMSRPQNLNVPLSQYSAQQVAAQYNAIPQDYPVNPQEPIAYQRRPSYLGTQQHLPSEYLYSQSDSSAGAPVSPRDPFQDSNRRRAPAIPMSLDPSMLSALPTASSGASLAKEIGLEALMPDTASMLAGGSGGPGRVEAINSVRNQQYMSKLAQHQSELQNYSQKQMEYLDQQRRYQQQMIDHQAGAALLMQQQQQQLLEEQIERAKQLSENPFAAQSEAQSGAPDNTVGGRLLTQDNTGDDVRRRSMGHKKTYTDDDMVVTDENLKQYFKEQYGIDIPDDGTQLTDDERDTLRLLKRELQEKKEDAIKEGSFKTMTKLKGKVMKEMQRHSYSSSSSSRSSEMKKGRCPPCVPVKLSQIKGSWTQIYGNPSSLKKTFSTIMSLEEMNADGEGPRTLSMSSKKPICVGMEITSPKPDKATLNVFFGDDGEENAIHEMKGDLFRQDDDSLLMSTDMYNSQVCVVKAGPAEVSQLEYIVLAETAGSHPCSSLHVFARNIDEFHLRFYDDFADFMKTKLRSKEVLPISKIPQADMCQLN